MTEDNKINVAELARKAAKCEKMSEEELSAWIQIITCLVCKLEERLDKLKDI